MSKLSKFERTSLILQYRIHSALLGEKDAYNDEIDILSHGYEFDYDTIFEDLSGPLDDDDSQFVHNILWIYYLMKLNRNRDAVEGRVAAKRAPDGRLMLETMEPKFPGFDGNNQSQYYGYARFLIEKQGKYPEHKGYLNSHGSQPSYEVMITLWKGWGSPSTLTDAQVDELLSV